MKKDLGQKLYTKNKLRIPGGSQLLSKKPEIYLPGFWPAYFKKAKGCEVISIGKKKFIDCTNNSVGMCTLGYANSYVAKHVYNAINNGNMSTLNSIDEVKMTNLILKLHPWFDSVRYANSGGEIASIAIRIARAYTKKDKILFCGYHGWHDWYISSNLSTNNLEKHLLPNVPSSGIPKVLKNTAIPFEYNNFADFKKKFDANKKNLGVVIMEPTRSFLPKEKFLEKIKSYCKKNNVVLIFDEITSGWRECLGGIHKKLKVHPDLAIFSKATSNGYPFSCVIGKKKIMQHAASSFISSANWTDRIGFAAAIATINFMKKNKSQSQIKKKGKFIKRGWRKISKKYNIELNITGLDSLPTFSFKRLNNDIAMTYFTQEMLKKNILATGQFFPTIAHSSIYLNKYFIEFEKIFKKISELKKDNSIKSQLLGKIKYYKFNVIN